jgi:hypothetical protein
MLLFTAPSLFNYFAYGLRLSLTQVPHIVFCRWHKTHPIAFICLAFGLLACHLRCIRKVPGYARHTTHVADAHHVLLSTYWGWVARKTAGSAFVCLSRLLLPSVYFDDITIWIWSPLFMVLSSPSLSPAAFVSIRVIVPVSTLPFYLTSPLALHVCVAALLFIPRSWCHGCYCPASWHFSVLQGWYSVAARFEGLIVSGLIILSQL